MQIIFQIFLKIHSLILCIEIMDLPNLVFFVPFVVNNSHLKLNNLSEKQNSPPKELGRLLRDSVFAIFCLGRPGRERDGTVPSRAEPPEPVAGSATGDRGSEAHWCHSEFRP